MNQASLLDRAPFVSQRLAYFESIGSTNDAIRALSAQGLSRPVAIARQQTAGRGRLSRRFISPPDSGLYLSMGLPLPPGELAPTVRAACGVARALERLTDRALGVKWVNDILLDGFKVVGILAEASGNTVTVGIGVNVNNPREDFLPELPHASSLAACCGRRFAPEDAAALVVEEMDRVWDEPDETALFTYYKDHLVTLGRAVRVLGAAGERFGTALDLEPDAALLVRFDDSGAVERVIFGDVSVRG
ncbi:MAG: biotin--[acetyl-CoA-carboxylase] ligase, partial [Oscillospiraceae bacterium]